MKKTILALSLIMGISSAASVSAALPQSIRIGTDTTYAPFSSKDSKGNFIGFDIDLGNELCSRIKVKCDGTGIGLRKEDGELKAAFDKALGEMRKDGTYDKMAKKYFNFNVYGD